MNEELIKNLKKLMNDNETPENINNSLVYIYKQDKKEISKMDNKELYINSLCFTVVFFPLVTAFIYIAALLMDNIFY